MSSAISPDHLRESLSISLLGLPEVRWAGQPVHVARRQPRALLYRLAAELRPVPRAQLCYLFWPDLGDATARRNLTRLLVLLRQALRQSAVLLADDTSVSLDRDQVWSDTTAFARLTTLDTMPSRRAALTRAVTLARGPFLDGFTLPDCLEFETWLEGERRNWERRALDTLAMLIEAHTVAQDYAAAIASAQQYLAADEFAEDIHRRLIALYAAIGDRTAALRQFERCALALERELGVSPLPETRAVFELVLNGAAVLPDQSPNGRLRNVASPVVPSRSVTDIPVPTSTLIGRTNAVAEVMQLLQRADVRLLTLSGPGGTGKTRLALEVASLAAPSFSAGAVFVPLAPLRDAALVIPAIMRVLGLPDQGDRPPFARLADALRDRALLLVLDNVEHLASAAVEVAALLAAAPQLTVLTTSRALLHVSGEYTYHVTPLVLPDAAHLPPLDALAQVESVALFLERVRARLPAFRLTEANAREVAAICVRLDGLPLAIELAAARAALLSPRMLLARLHNRLSLLTYGPRDLPERQRTLRAMIDWSYGLLDLSEQVLFGRLAVFAGSWGLDAVEAVSDTVGPLATSTLDSLHGLLDKHLVQRVGSIASEPRFSMLETLREYALERLEERGEARAGRQAHAQHFRALACLAAPALHGAEQIAWFDRLDEEQANLRIALASLLETAEVEGALRLAGALYWYWHVRGHLVEGRAWLERTLAAVDRAAVPPPAALLAHAHFAVGQLIIDQGDPAAAQPHCERSLALWREMERDPAAYHAVQRPLILAAGRVLQARAMQGDHSTNSVLAPEIAARITALADPWFEAYEAYNQGTALLEHFGDVASAQTRLLRAQELFHALGDSWHQAKVLPSLGLIAVLQGEIAVARTRYEAALNEARALKERALEALALDKLGEVARLTGDDDLAANLYAASTQIYRALDSRLDSARLTHNTGYLALHASDTTLARTRFSESLVDFRTLGQPRGQAEALPGLAAVAAAARTPASAQLAACWWGAASTAHAAEGAPVWPVNQMEITRYQELARQLIGSSTYTAAYTEGTKRSLGEAVAEALSL